MRMQVYIHARKQKHTHKNSCTYTHDILLFALFFFSLVRSMNIVVKQSIEELMESDHLLDRLSKWI